MFTTCAGRAGLSIADTPANADCMHTNWACTQLCRHLLNATCPQQQTKHQLKECSHMELNPWLEAVSMQPTNIKWITRTIRNKKHNVIYSQFIHMYHTFPLIHICVWCIPVFVPMFGLFFDGDVLVMAALPTTISLKIKAKKCPFGQAWRFTLHR